MNGDMQKSQLSAQVEEQPAQTALQRVRAHYARQEALRYVSHLEMQQVWERTLRRAGVPLAYSQGFNPRPRLHMASALPLGFLSRCEICDFWLNLPADDPGAPGPDSGVFVTDLAERIQAAAPPGLKLTRIELVPLSLPPLQTQVIAAEYEAAPYDPVEAGALAQAAARLLREDSIPRERRGKPYDLRPLIEALESTPGTPPRLVMRLAAREGATGRPEEVLDALGFDAAAYRVERTALILKTE